MCYKLALRAKGIRPIPPYDALRTSKATPRVGDIELAGARTIQLRPDRRKLPFRFDPAIERRNFGKAL